MKILSSWLKEFVDVDWSPERFTEDLTMAGLEVEGFEDLAATFDRFVVGSVASCEKHPKADRLTVCHVDVGTERLHIVCGAPNVAAGQKVAVGLLGATVPHNQHDPDGKPFVLAKVKIRGVESSGMICSARELGLGSDGDGILVLDPQATVGTSLAEHLGRTDVVYEVGITPNRPDCLSHLGVAREVAMLTGGTVRLPATAPNETGTAAEQLAKIEIRDADLCPRYCGRVLSNVRVSPSPPWLQHRLESAGVRPINAIVDATNYVMLELGHPLHAFDLDRLAGNSIVVRRAGSDRAFTTLDGKERGLQPDMLMICDAERAVAIGGVMGGANSEISGATTRILIEGAYFQPASVRRTARTLGLSTEASYRFERGADPAMASMAVDRAARLIQELTGASVHPGLIDVAPGRQEPAAVRVRVQRTNEILGTEIPGPRMREFLERIGAKVAEPYTGEFAVVPPSYRVDLTQEIDFVEEVARVHGYNNIPTQTRSAIDFSPSTAPPKVEEEVRAHLVGAGWREILAISLQQESLAALTGETPVKVLNPVSAEMQALRTSMVPGTLEIIRMNHHQGSRNLRLFEVGKVYHRRGSDTNALESYVEEVRLMLAWTGDHQLAAFDRAARSVDLMDLKGELDGLLSRLCLDKYRFIPYRADNTLTESSIGVEINGTYGGWFGEVRRELAQRFEIETPVFACELSLPLLERVWTTERTFRALPRYPQVVRDLAFVVDRALPQGDLEASIRSNSGSLLESLVLFDAYEGAQAGEGKKSLAYSLAFRAGDHTLTDEEVDARILAIVEQARTSCGAELRG
ncbi:MAG: phenylalanine--tRNA ligase subunit beta [Bacteroidota bacterium]